MMDDQPVIADEYLFQAVQLGQKSEQFLKHDPLGRVLVDKAAAQYREAMDSFQSMKITDILAHPEKVVAIRQRMDVARSFIVWMNDSIIDAERAEEELHNRDMSESVID